MNKPVRQLLWTACSPSRLEWLFNNQRSRHSLAPHERCLLPSGTTSNEALHSQINSWSRSTHEVHRSTLKLKLQVYTLGKQLSHHLALCFPPVRQTAENVLLARGLGESPWTEERWKNSCCTRDDPARAVATWLYWLPYLHCVLLVVYLAVGSLRLLSRTSKEKCQVPLHQERLTESLRVRQWTLKRPQLPRQKHTKKRTPLTVPRKHSVRRGGVKPNK